jgi:hypothetical protein
MQSIDNNTKCHLPSLGSNTCTSGAEVIRECGNTAGDVAQIGAGTVPDHSGGYCICLLQAIGGREMPVSLHMPRIKQ